MKKADPDDLRPEYRRGDFGPGIRGKYLESYRSGTNLVLLHPDVAKAFPTDEAVNDALRSDAPGGTMKRHVGSSFDEFLTDEGLLSEAEATAVKRVIAYQLSQFMEENKLSKSAMAKRMQTSRSALDRLLDSSNPSVTLQTMDRAARALGKKLRIELI